MKIYEVEGHDNCFDEGAEFYPTLSLARAAAKEWAARGVSTDIKVHEIGRLSAVTACRLASGRGWSISSSHVETREATEAA